MITGLTWNSRIEEFFWLKQHSQIKSGNWDENYELLKTISISFTYSSYSVHVTKYFAHVTKEFWEAIDPSDLYVMNSTYVE